MSSNGGVTPTRKRKKKSHSKSNIVDNYLLGSIIGKGAFGTVWKALNTITGEMVAIKQVSLKGISPSSLNSIASEVELLKRLKHKNIVPYVTSVRKGSTFNIVLEYIEGGSLLHVLTNYGILPESLVAEYLRQVLKGLDYLHKQGVIHRDIKPANILVTKSGRIKLADFGIAATVGEGEAEGSPFWMAPEVIQMGMDVTTAADIWSFACTAIHLLTGQPPYGECNAMTAMYRMVEDDSPPLVRDGTENLLSFLMACFQKDPSKRPTASELLSHPFFCHHLKIIHTCR